METLIIIMTPAYLYHLYIGKHIIGRQAAERKCGVRNVLLLLPTCDNGQQKRLREACPEVENRGCTAAAPAILCPSFPSLHSSCEALKILCLGSSTPFSRPALPACNSSTMYAQLSEQSMVPAMQEQVHQLP